MKQDLNSKLSKYVDRLVNNIGSIFVVYDIVETTSCVIDADRMRLCSAVTEFEVERAKSQLKMDLMTRLSTPEAACNALARLACLMLLS